MNLRKLSVSMLALALILTLGGVATAADDRPHEGKVISVDKDAMVMSVQGDKDDQWTLYWTETTKLKGDLAITEVKVGDKVHFEFVEKDGKKLLTELKRTDKAKG
jgi:Cu/Ag efflux protein CusF